MEKSIMDLSKYVAACFLLLWASSSEVRALDISILEETGCMGRGFFFKDPPPQKCLLGTGQSVLVGDATICQLSGPYSGANCAKQEGAAFGNVCYLKNATGASWENRCRRRRDLLSADEELQLRAGESSGLDPAGVVFIENPTKGSWILKTPDAAQHFADLGSVPVAERTLWMQARGAEFIRQSPNLLQMGN